MYLKSIEVNGFKSFANKIVFEFNDGITGIVGPNGSGKSNVGDAVRWVLGEQSAKQLRGSKMEDVIFSGTELRKAQSSAYVAITLDNSDHKLPIDFTEVKVARRVFRSGESEYLINGASCRLKDVQELFFDTGIGKEGYSIIGQGQIEKILSGKPEDRRELFDEAAGIVKYKKRKKQAEKNLAEERDNLSRITDILKEIEKQLVPLEKQSVVAKEYLSLRDKLRAMDINLFLMNYDRIHEDDKSTDGKIDIAQSQFEEAQGNLESTKAEYENLERQLEEINNDIDTFKNSLNEHRLKSQGLTGEINVINAQIEAFITNSSHFESRATAISSDLAKKQEELAQTKVQIDENNEKLSKLDDEKVELDDRHMNAIGKVSELTNLIEDKKKQIVEFVKENSDIRTSLERNSTILEQNNIKKASLTQKLLQQKSNESVAQVEVDKLKEEVDELSKKINELFEKNKSFSEKNNEISARLSQKEKDNQILQQDTLRASSRFESMKNISERYDGYGASIRKVMEQKVKIPGIIGVVADIIKSDKKYETAIETALGGSIQNIVTDDENTAKKLISFLKVNRYGRATFLPLTAVNGKGGFSSPDALKEKGAIGTVDTLIKRDSQFDGIVKSLVGRVLAVDNIDNAIAIARKYRSSFRIVTLEGEVLNPGGAMSGGAYKNSSNLLGRKREIEELEKQIKEKEEKLSKSKDSIEKLILQRKELRLKLEENNSKLQDLRIRKSSIDVSYEQAVKRLDDLKKSFGDMSSESSQIGSAEKSLKENISKLNDTIRENEIKSAQNEKDIAQCEEKLAKAKEEEEEINSKLAQIGNDYSGLENSRLFILENYRRIEKDIQKLNEEQKELTSSMDGSDDLISSKKSEIDEKTKEISQISEDIHEIEKKIEEASLAKEHINKQHKSFFDKREELSEQISSLDKELFRLRSRKEKLNEELDNEVSYMWEQYEMTYSSALPYKNEEYNEYSKVKNMTADLKKQIRALGDVNVNAVEDYKNLLERYDLLKTQHDDLAQSEEALMKIIDDLDEEMRKQFEEKFVQIKEQFNIVFKQLFGGGKGTLELMEDEDILEAGIKIIAQPPGKKLQNMMMLSGGEKSLTAISLLFAIQNLKPSPFCLLDEIEAALDDSNVKRFAQYLHKLTANTQFIVITHRRGTMSAADVLYGITMQEKGVSTLVSVNLIENELDK